MKKKIIVTSLSIVLLIMLLLSIKPLITHMDKRHPCLFLIPENYKGWVVIYYDQPGTKPLQKENGFIVHKINADGTLKTSTKDMEYGWAKDEFYFLQSDGNIIQIDPNVLIHDAKNGYLASSGAQTPAYQRFFVGSEEDYQKSDHNFTY